MYVKRVVLENVRGFEKLDFDFQRPSGRFAGWTAITGDNASGKTTLLKAIAAALVGPDAVRALQPSFRGWVRQNCKEALVSVELVAGERDHFAKGRKYEQPFWADLRLSENGGPDVSLAPLRGVRKGLGPTHGPWADNPDGWFCVGYGPFRRLYGASPDAQRVMLGPVRVARFATMFREDATLYECEVWIRELHHRSLEGRELDKTLLEQVKRILNDDFLQNGLRIEDVDSQGVWLSDPKGAILPLADMSEGYRAALAMLIDILRQLAVVHEAEGLVADRQGAMVVPHEGVVLIDEVDAHLHPEWQRRVGFWLKRKLPNMQFIVTTHSPIICQAADEHGLFTLPQPGSSARPFRVDEAERQRIVRERPNAIYVSPAFGMRHTRSPLAVTNRARYSQLRAKSAAGALPPNEQREMQKLLPFVGDLDDPQDEDA